MTGLGESPEYAEAFKAALNKPDRMMGRMTKVELIDRIMAVTRGQTSALDRGIEDERIKATLMDCVDAFAETLLSRVKLEVEQAVHTATENAVTRLQIEGRQVG